MMVIMMRVVVMRVLMMIMLMMIMLMMVMVMMILTMTMSALFSFLASAPPSGALSKQPNSTQQLFLRGKTLKNICC